MTFIRLSIFTVVLICFSVFTLADSYYFIYSIQNPLSSDGVVQVYFDYTLSGAAEKDFVIRPIASSGIAKIYNDSIQTWIDSTDLWSKMPLLAKQEKISIQGLSSNSADLYFLIQYTKTGIVYKTPSKKIWSNASIKNYPQMLNANLFKPTEVVSEESSETIPNALSIQSTPSANSNGNNNNIALIVFAVVTALTGAYMLKYLHVKNR
ncbi:MAG TPA: hypothetical protein VLI92_04735 [Candidatus Saccharimonadales bacterium]|nr:hypothetical protein [Candidatus Saccharimonadales bacterium]